MRALKGVAATLCLFLAAAAATVPVLMLGYVYGASDGQVPALSGGNGPLRAAAMLGSAAG
ncbi:MAG: hypothetical protein K2X87_18535 [Gemmataceae bacterium]|nr:hypothetical protein [Gemmataceae bacterium]